MLKVSLGAGRDDRRRRLRQGSRLSQRFVIPYSDRVGIIGVIRLGHQAQEVAGIKCLRLQGLFMVLADLQPLDARAERGQQRVVAL